jgi:hypothetical protein
MSGTFNLVQQLQAWDFLTGSTGCPGHWPNGNKNDLVRDAGPVIAACGNMARLVLAGTLYVESCVKEIVKIN